MAGDTMSTDWSGAVEPAPERPERQLRVGDAERNEAVSALGEHFAAGRLDHGELDDRTQAAYAARTRADLERLFTDLPEPAPYRRVPAAPSRPTGRRQPRPGWPLIPVVPILFVLAAILIATRITPFLLIPLFFLLFSFGRRGWR
jgi:Domain of unknown function (DUF1707)